MTVLTLVLVSVNSVYYDTLFSLHVLGMFVKLEINIL